MAAVSPRRSPPYVWLAGVCGVLLLLCGSCVGSCLLVREATYGPPREHRRAIDPETEVVVTERSDPLGDGFMTCGYELRVVVTRSGRAGEELVHNGVYDDCSLSWYVGASAEGAVVFATDGALYRESPSGWIEVDHARPAMADESALRWTLGRDVENPWTQAQAYRALRHLRVRDAEASYDELIRRRAVEYPSALSVLCRPRCAEPTMPADVQTLCAEHASYLRACARP